jgi:hypothetical protein
MASKIIDTWHSCPIHGGLPTDAPCAGDQVLAYLGTKGGSNGGAEAIPLDREDTPPIRLRNFGNYRLRILLVADGTRDYRRDQPCSGQSSPHGGACRRS